MTLLTMGAMMALIPPPSGSGQQSTAPSWSSFVPMGLLLVVFYFALIRPQQKKAREHGEMLKAIKPGDKVITTGGVVAVVVSVKEKTVNIRSADSKFEVTKAAIAEVTERSGEGGES